MNIIFSALCGLKHQCHKQARCVNNQCVCKHGLYGDGINSCDSKLSFFEADYFRCKFLIQKLKYEM